MKCFPPSSYQCQWKAHNKKEAQMKLRPYSIKLSITYKHTKLFNYFGIKKNKEIFKTEEKEFILYPTKSMPRKALRLRCVKEITNYILMKNPTATFLNITINELATKERNAYVYFTQYIFEKKEEEIELKTAKTVETKLKQIIYTKKGE